MKMVLGVKELPLLEKLMNKQKKHVNLTYLFLYLVAISTFLFFSSCSLDVLIDKDVDESDIYYSELSNISNWTEKTHGKLTTDEINANMDKIFNTSKLQKIRIVIEADNWELMNENLEDLADELGHSTDFNSIDNPFFVPCEFFYSPDGTEDNEKEWYKVGIRFKGNSSLYNANCNKLPFKLDFDEFEDEYSDIKNQRFYGFKQLNLKNNYSDKSEMHEVVATELFIDFGLNVPHCSFYELYINVDGGDEEDDIYYGLYTLVEEVDDTVINTQYDDDSGNLYKPEDDAATFAKGTYDEDEYGLQTDNDESYEDILSLYNAINNTDSASWKTELENLFDVDIFLKWLASNSVMQNWDTYGIASHNYFLYNNPSGMFEWIPWDNNEALISNRQCLDLDMNEVDDSWPLIRNILDNAEYTATYKEYVKEFAASLFNEDYLNPIYEKYKVQIETSVSNEGNYYTFTSSSKFESAVETLKNNASVRNAVALTYANN